MGFHRRKCRRQRAEENIEIAVPESRSGAGKRNPFWRWKKGILYPWNSRSAVFEKRRVGASRGPRFRRAHSRCLPRGAVSWVKKVQDDAVRVGSAGHGPHVGQLVGLKKAHRHGRQSRQRSTPARFRHSDFTPRRPQKMAHRALPSTTEETAVQGPRRQLCGSCKGNPRVTSSPWYGHRGPSRTSIGPFLCTRLCQGCVCDEQLSRGDAGELTLGADQEPLCDDPAGHMRLPPLPSKPLPPQRMTQRAPPCIGGGGRTGDRAAALRAVQRTQP